MIVSNIIVFVGSISLDTYTFSYRIDFIEFRNCSDVHIGGDGNIAISRIRSRQDPSIIVSQIIIE